MAVEYCSNLRVGPITSNLFPIGETTTIGYYCELTKKQCVGYVPPHVVFQVQGLNIGVVDRCPARNKTLEMLASTAPSPVGEQ